MHTAIYVNICTSLRCAVGTVLNAPNCISMLRNVSYTMRKFHWVCREASTSLSPKILTKCVFYENFTVNRRSDFSKAKEGSTVVQACAYYTDSDAQTDRIILEITEFIKTLPTYNRSKIFSSNLYMILHEIPHGNILSHKRFHVRFC